MQAEDQIAASWLKQNWALPEYSSPPAQGACTCALVELQLLSGLVYCHLIESQWALVSHQPGPRFAVECPTLCCVTLLHSNHIAAAGALGCCIWLHRHAVVSQAIVGSRFASKLRYSWPPSMASYLADKVEEALLALELVPLAGGQVLDVHLKLATPEFAVTAARREYASGNVWGPSRVHRRHSCWRGTEIWRPWVEADY